MRICITGSASSVAEKIIERLGLAHDLTLFDIRHLSAPPSRGTWLSGSILDRAFLKKALRGHDAVIHTAIARDNRHTTNEERWRVNVEGTLAVAEEAAAAAVKKFIYISSMSVFDGYDPSIVEGKDESLEPRPSGFYGFTKYLGENIVRFHADKFRIPSVTLRLVSVVPDENAAGDVREPAFDPIFRTSGRDVAQAVELALERDLELVYEVFHISGGNPKRFWSHEKAARLLGYQPADAWER